MTVKKEIYDKIPKKLEKSIKQSNLYKQTLNLDSSMIDLVSNIDPIALIPQLNLLLNKKIIIPYSLKIQLTICILNTLLDVTNRNTISLEDIQTLTLMFRNTEYINIQDVRNHYYNISSDKFYKIYGFHKNNHLENVLIKLIDNIRYQNLRKK